MVRLMEKKGGTSTTATSTARRSTNQLRAVRAVFEREVRPLGPGEVLALASADSPNLGLTTVYRLLKKLQSEGVLSPVCVPNQPPRYEMAGLRHHHHFLCTRCDRTYDIAACRSDFHRLAPQGFHVEHHEIFLSGRCDQCL